MLYILDYFMSKHRDLSAIQGKKAIKNHELHLPPIINKKEWLHVPTLDNEKIFIPETEKFVIHKQDNQDSCGLCAGKMVINTILQNR